MWLWNTHTHTHTHTETKQINETAEIKALRNVAKIIKGKYCVIREGGEIEPVNKRINDKWTD
jgi:hypothetical protein